MDIKFFKKIQKSHKIKKETFDIKYGNYWKFIVVFFLLFVAGSIVFGFYFFNSLDKENQLLIENTNTKKDPINKSRLDAVLEYFENKENKSKGIISNPIPVTDPSILVPLVGIEPTSKP